MPQQPIVLEIERFSGLELERGRLERPVNSWEILDNFQLIRDGSIQKLGGNVPIGPFGIEGQSDPYPSEDITPFPSPVVVYRDWRRVSTDPLKIVAITMDGKLYVLVELFPGSGTFSAQAPKTLSVNPLTDAPFVTTFPSRQNEVEELIYLIAALGDSDRPKKFDGAVVTNLGVDVPEKNWASAYEHSLTVKQVTVTQDDKRGTHLLGGRKYRFSWYNPFTRRDSTLAPFNLLVGTQRVANDSDPPDFLKTNIAPTLGTAQGNEIQQWVEEVAFIVSAEVATAMTEIRPDADYTQVRIWATREGNDAYLLLTNVYNTRGQKITDSFGAIDADLITMNQTILFDGWVPKVNSELDTFFLVDEGTLGIVTVAGPGQSGNSLIITAASGPPQFALIKLGDDDPTIYSVVSFSVIGGGQYQYVLDQDLVTSPADAQVVTFVRVPPMLDSDLVEPARAEGYNSPPPENASWGAVFQNRLWLVVGSTLFFSALDDFESFPPENTIPFFSDDEDPITALLTGRQTGFVSEGIDTRLVVAKSRSSAQLQGASEVDFAKRDLYPETGVVHKRAATAVSGLLVAVTRQGIELLEGQVPVFIGRKIRDLIDPTKIDDTTIGPDVATDRKEGQVFFALHKPGITFADGSGDDQNNFVVVMCSQFRQSQNGVESPFSTYSALPTGINCLGEAGEGDFVKMVAAGADGVMYQILRGGVNSGGPVIALAKSQNLPQDDKVSRKIFRRVWFEGNEVDEDAGWEIKYIVDGLTYSPARKMYQENMIGLVGKQIQIFIQHKRAVEETEIQPMLSNMILEYIPIGVAR